MIDQDIASYLAHLKYVQGRAKNTILAYRTDLRQFRQVVRRELNGSVDASDLDPDCIEAYLGWLDERGFQATTISRKLAALRSFFQFLDRVHQFNSEELRAELWMNPPDREPPRVLSRTQIDRLIHAPAGSTGARDIRDAAILSFLYATGLRSAEATRVEVDDIDLERGVLDRPKAAPDPLPLGVAYHAVERYMKEGRPQLLRNRAVSTLFLNQRGEGLSRQGLWLVVKKWSAACNLGGDVSPYTLRHSLTRHMLQDGRSRREVQKILGLASSHAVRRHLQAVTS